MYVQEPKSRACSNAVLPSQQSQIACQCYPSLSHLLLASNSLHKGTGVCLTLTVIILGNPLILWSQDSNPGIVAFSLLFGFPLLFYLPVSPHEDTESAPLCSAVSFPLLAAWAIWILHERFGGCIASWLSLGHYNYSFSFLLLEARDHLYLDLKWASSPSTCPKGSVRAADRVRGVRASDTTSDTSVPIAGPLAGKARKWLNILPLVNAHHTFSSPWCG